MSEEKNTSNNESIDLEKKNTGDKIDNGKACAMLAYLLIGLIWYFADEKIKVSSLAKFHVKQAIVLFVVATVGSTILTMIPIFGWIVLPFFSLATLAWAVMGIINAANGDKKELPIVGSYADKFLKF